MFPVTNRLRRLIKLAVMGGVREEHDVDTVRKIKMINIGSLIGITNLIPLGCSVLARGACRIAFFEFLAAFVLSANQIHLRMTGKHEWSIYSGVTCAGGLFFYLFYTGGVSHSGHLWFYTFPLFSIFLLGYKKGTIATLLLLGVSLLALSLDGGFESTTIYTVQFQIRFAASVTVVLLYTFFFDSTRNAAQEKLRIKNMELERKIVEGESAAKTLKKAMETAEAANRAKSDFLANMSHELRTPLNHIIGFTELVVDKRAGELTATQEEYLNDALTSSRHLLTLLNDILDLAKVEAGKLELEPTVVDPRTLMENCLTMIKEKAVRRGIRLTTDIDGIPDTVIADEPKLKRILYNLLSNAVKFTPEGGRICLMSKKIEGGEPRMSNPESPATQDLKMETKDFMEISVADTGIGLKAEFKERIFGSFEQVESSTNRKFQGAGLGLSLTKSLVELHGGKIWAESEGEGKGSAFRFVLPIQVFRQSKNSTKGGRP